MNTIKKLSPELIAHISAGQVVDRPATVVKELIDNALDARASHITIELTDGGLSSISVTDTGVGMAREDIEMSFQPYTTSKISTLDDLLHIGSFGFRGEALASIAQVADLSIDSKMSDTLSGWHIRVVGGEVVESEPVGMPDGTRVVVERLFHSVPARRKFVKAYATEVRVCTQCVASYALAHPNVSFLLKHNGHEILHVTAHQTVLDRIGVLVDQRSARTARLLDFGKGAIRLSGYLGHPSTSRGSDAHMYIHVNGRPIQNPELKRAIRSMYGALLPQRSFPMCVISIEYPIESIDVNVDPQKTRIRMYGEESIRATIQEALTDIFVEASTGYSVASGRKMDTQLAEYIKEAHTAWTPRDIEKMQCMQIRNVYIAVEYEHGLMLYDQHAVHERILYEEYLDAFEHQREHASVHTYDSPRKITISPSLRAGIDELVPILETHGCVLKLSGQDIELVSVPVYFAHRDATELVHELIEACTSQEGDIERGVIDPVTHRTLTYLACRSAIKAGDPLSEEEMKKLITTLLACKKPQTCPHGRPTCIHISAQELDSLFKR